jgi:hypothetical protein
MPIVGITFTSISGKAENTPVEGDINVNSSPSIKNIIKKDVPILEAGGVIAIDFTFDIKYDPKIGEINFEGEVLYKTDKAESIVKAWKKEKKIDANITVEVLNSVLRKCMSKAIDIANELRLPPPMQFPTVKKAE